jgi:hypothetical protein
VLAIDRFKTRHRDFAVSNVPIDANCAQFLARAVQCHLPDNPVSGQFGNDIIALSIGIGIGGVSDLKGEPG